MKTMLMILLLAVPGAAHANPGEPQPRSLHKLQRRVMRLPMSPELRRRVGTFLSTAARQGKKPYLWNGSLTLNVDQGRRSRALNISRKGIRFQSMTETGEWEPAMRVQVFNLVRSRTGMTLEVKQWGRPDLIGSESRAEYPTSYRLTGRRGNVKVARGDGLALNRAAQRAMASPKGATSLRRRFGLSPEQIYKVTENPLQQMYGAQHQLHAP
ncbi:MAG: hypothetical protein ACK2UO_06350 [Caldilineaceae bacterium]